MNIESRNIISDGNEKSPANLAIPKSLIDLVLQEVDMEVVVNAISLEQPDRFDEEQRIRHIATLAEYSGARKAVLEIKRKLSGQVPEPYNDSTAQLKLFD